MIYKDKQNVEWKQVKTLEGYDFYKKIGNQFFYAGYLGSLTGTVKKRHESFIQP